MGSLRAGVLALIASTGLARAQPKLTAQQIQQAGDLVKKAIAKSQAGEHALAIELYEQAYDIVPQPMLLSNIGSEYQQAQNAAEAVKYFCRYLEADPNGQNVAFATAQIKVLQGPLGGDIDDSDVCRVKPKPKPKPVPAAPPVAMEPPVPTGASFGPTGGPTPVEESHPGRALEYTGAAVMIASAVPLVIGLGYTYKSYSLNRQIANHETSTPWPQTIDGIDIKQWPAEGARFNRDAYLFGIPGAVGVLLGGGILYYGIRSGREDRAVEHARVVPIATPTHAGVALVGTF